MYRRYLLLVGTGLLLFYLVSVVFSPKPIQYKTITTHEFNACSIQSGDKVIGMTVAGVKGDCSASGIFMGEIDFSGETTVGGSFEPISQDPNQPEEFDNSYINGKDPYDFGGFYVASDSIDKLPKVLGDDRTVWFRIGNETDELRKKYGTNTIKMKIKDYSIVIEPRMGPSNMAAFVEIID